EVIAPVCPACGAASRYQGPVPGGYRHVEYVAPATYYLVSAIVASHPAASGRTDLLVPAEQVRDSAGRVTGCR
ncbi:MAG: hypothetical protein AAB368_03225, partial [bacterium]